MKDFWLSSGHHLLDRDERGRLRVTDEFMKVYLARPELAPPAEACVVERTLYAALLADPWRPVAVEQINAIADDDARENWTYMVTLRDHLVAHRTLEATYVALLREAVRVPPIFLDQLVHLILRNALDQCDDAYMLRGAELFFRPQRMTVHDGSLLAADAEQINPPAVASPFPGQRWEGDTPLAAMLGLASEPQIEVLSDGNASSYWERSDRFDLALDLTTGRRGLIALGTVIVCWLKHLLDLDVVVEPLNEMRDVALAWYVGLDGDATRIGDALWNGLPVDDATRARVVGLFRLTFRDSAVVVERMAGEPVYLILAMSPERILRMKPQNLLAGLPVRHPEPIT